MIAKLLLKVSSFTLHSYFFGTYSIKVREMCFLFCNFWLVVYRMVTSICVAIVLYTFGRWYTFVKVYRLVHFYQSVHCHAGIQCLCTKSNKSVLIGTLWQKCTHRHTFVKCVNFSLSIATCMVADDSALSFTQSVSLFPQPNHRQS
jgi:hypothetical protein